MDYELDKIISLYRNDEVGAWKPDPAFAESLGCPIISQSAPALMEEPDRDTFLWRYFHAMMQAVYGPSWRWNCQFQKQGTCGGQAGKIAWDYATAIMASVNASVFPGRSSVAGMYSGSRVEIGNSPGRSQGTYGAHIAAFCAKYGAVLLKDIGCPDNYYVTNGMDQDEQYAMQWTASREGIPAQFENSKFPVGGLTRPRTAREAGKLIQQGIPIITGNTLIPTGKRDQHGFSRVQRAGGHLTAYIAVRYNPFGLLYLNSWGNNWAQGPVYVEDQPLGSVWLSEDESNAQISQGDTFGLGNTKNLADKYQPAFITVG